MTGAADHHEAQVAAVLDVLRKATGQAIGSTGLTSAEKASPWLRALAERCVTATRPPAVAEPTDTDPVYDDVAGNGDTTYIAAKLGDIHRQVSETETNVALANLTALKRRVEAHRCQPSSGAVEEDADKEGADVRHRIAIDVSALSPGVSSTLLCQLDGRHSGDATIGDSRMPACTVWHMLDRGMTAADIHRSYPWVSLEDIAVLDRLRRDVQPSSGAVGEDEADRWNQGYDYAWEQIGAARERVVQAFLAQPRDCDDQRSPAVLRIDAEGDADTALAALRAPTGTGGEACGGGTACSVVRADHEAIRTWAGAHGVQPSDRPLFETVEEVRVKARLSGVVYGQEVARTNGQDYTAPDGTRWVTVEADPETGEPLAVLNARTENVALHHAMSHIRGPREDVSDPEADGWVRERTRIRAFAAHSQAVTVFEGHVVAHSLGPQVAIQGQDGETRHWRTKYVEAIPEPDPARTLAVGDVVETVVELGSLADGAVLRGGPQRLVMEKIGNAWSAVGNARPVHAPDFLPARILDLPALVDLIDCDGDRWRETEPGADQWYCESPGYVGDCSDTRADIERKHGPVREMPAKGGGEA